MEHTYGIEQGDNYMEPGRLISLIQDLTKPDRALLEWRIVDGWDYTTIARRLGIPRADLVKRVQRIQTDLRRKARALGAGETKLNRAALLTV
jgi:DNA-directed RNA polymerase specialized sigma24 family protein